MNTGHLKKVTYEGDIEFYELGDIVPWSLISDVFKSPDYNATDIFDFIMKYVTPGYDRSYPLSFFDNMAESIVKWIDGKEKEIEFVHDEDMEELGFGKNWRSKVTGSIYRKDK